jgi:hypothetical protein
MQGRCVYQGDFIQSLMSGLKDELNRPATDLSQVGTARYIAAGSKQTPFFSRHGDVHCRWKRGKTCLFQLGTILDFTM